MAKQEDIFKRVVSHAKEYGFIFPSSEIYDGLSAIYDYGQNGAELKNNIKQYWWKAMVQLNENIVGLDSAIFMHPTTWKASGHIDAFNDPLIDNKDSKKRFRADVLIEDYCAKLEDKAEKKVRDIIKKHNKNCDEKDIINADFVINIFTGYMRSNPNNSYSNFLGHLIDVEKILLNEDITGGFEPQNSDKIIFVYNILFPNENIKLYSSELEEFSKKLNELTRKIYTKEITLYQIVSTINFIVTKNIFEFWYATFDKQRIILSRLAQYLEKNDLDNVKALIEELEIADPDTGSKNWTEVRQFNLMFGTKLGAAAENAMDLYLRPETAQGIFVNFLNVQKTSRHKLPFGIAQIGKAFRNEIVARQFIFRMREFEQMEMQFFVPPGTELKFYETWKQKRLNWHLALGLGEENYKFHDHEKLAHYANAAADIEFKFPFGFKELEGIHSRTDYDLSAHEQHSGKKLQYFDPERGENYVPYVVETSVGLDRLFLAIFSHCLKDEVLEDGSERTVLSLPPALAPVKAAILPLMKKDGLGEYAEKIFNDLKYDFNLIYEDKDSIGKRYRRQDAIGTPFCITIDHDTLTDHTVTIRHRDTMEQERVPVSELRKIIDDKVSFRNLLAKI